jgi:transposase
MIGRRPVQAPSSSRLLFAQRRTSAPSLRFILATWRKRGRCSVPDAALGYIRPQLTYKLAWRGAKLTVADRWSSSSKVHKCCNYDNVIHQQTEHVTDRVSLCRAGNFVCVGQSATPQ